MQLLGEGMAEGDLDESMGGDAAQYIQITPEEDAAINRVFFISFSFSIAHCSRI